MDIRYTMLTTKPEFFRAELYIYLLRCILIVLHVRGLKLCMPSIAFLLIYCHR